MKRILMLFAAVLMLSVSVIAFASCGDEGGDTSHKHSYAKEVIEPNCTEQGYTTYTCSCGNSYIGDYVDALGHTEVVDEVVAPTCTETGLTIGKHCSVCEEVLEAQTVVDALGHKESAVVVENNIAPDCVNAGSYENVVYCTVCSAELSREKITVPALGHTEVIDNAVAPTCTETGLTEGKHCSVCEAILEAQTVVDALGHTEVIDEAVAPTCTETGLTAGKHCSVCEAILEAQSVVDALGHTEVIDEAVAPTCTETGLTAGKHCSVCEAILEAQTVVDALGHTEVIDDAVAPTCTETGLTEGKHCSVCEAILEAQSVVDALGHTAGTSVRENEISATCAKEGSYDEVVYCTVCSAELSRENVTVDALGHTAGTAVRENEISATCTKEGSYDEVVYCTVCSAELSRVTKTVDALGHTAGTAVRENEISATCTKEGSYDEVVYCTVCEAELSRVTKTVDALGHIAGTAVRENEISATCTKEGSYDEVVCCTVCSAELSREKVTVDALGHTAGTAVRENEISATCTKEGSYDEVVYCTVCSAELSRVTKTVDALGHTEVIDDAIAPTCTETGLTTGKHCSVCEEVLEAQTIVDALGHKEVIDDAVEPTCTATGLTAGKHCSVCEAILEAQTVVDALGHTEVIDDAVAPTCTESGLTAGKHCSVCDAVIEEQTVVDALGHSEGSVVVENNIAADCVNAGSYENVVYCTVCSAELSREKVTVDALGHTEIIDEAVAPTCTETGLTAGKYCSVCEEVLIAQTVVPATGHTEEAVRENEISATCTKEGSYEEVVYCGECNAEISRESKVIEKLTTHKFVNLICAVCGFELKESEGLKFTSNGDGTCYVSGIGTCTDKDLVIPSTSPEGWNVTGIGSSAFEDCTGIKSVIIPDSVTSIGKFAFWYCTSLTSVVIPNSVTSIGSSAFYGCYKLVEVINHSSLDIQAGSEDYGCVGYYAKEAHTGASKIVNYNDYLFYTYDGVNYLLGYVGEDTALVLPESYNGENYEIYDYAFYERDDITSVVIPDSVTSIGYDAFYDCYKLVEVINHSSLDITVGSEDYGYVGYYAIEVHTGESKIVNYNDYLFYTYNGVNYLLDYVGEDKALVLPESYNGENYEIYQFAFYNRDDITSVVIPDSVTSIGEDAFEDCDSITSVTIGNGVTSIGYDAFYDCYKLVEVINHSSLYITVGSEDYGNVGYYAIEVHTGESKIVNYNGYLFYTYNGVNYLVGYVGEDKALVLPKSYNGENYKIWKYAFSYRDDITSVVIPDSVTSIGDYAFEGCTGLTSVTIGNGVTSIGGYAFYHCDSITSVTIGNSVRRIGPSAFGYCDGLTSIKYRGTSSQWSAISKGSSWDYYTGSYKITYNYNGN